MMAAHYPPARARAMDEAGQCPPDLLRRMGELGLLAVPFPEAYGGLDGDWISVTLIQERLGYHAAIAASLYSITVDFGGMSLLSCGTAAQRDALLPPLIQGEMQFSLALSESTAGTDAGAWSPVPTVVRPVGTSMGARPGSAGPTPRPTC
jgi:short/branched chain acyl-CoA dehydrogenase